MIHVIIDYLIVATISFGVSFSFSLTSGPFSLFKSVRNRLEKSKYRFVREGASCPICVSFWASCVVSFLMGHGVIGWFFSWGITCVITSLSPDGSEEE